MRRGWCKGLDNPSDLHSFIKSSGAGIRKWPQQEAHIALVISTLEWPRCTCVLGLTAFGKTAGVPVFLLLNTE